MPENDRYIQTTSITATAPLTTTLPVLSTSETTYIHLSSSQAFTEKEYSEQNHQPEDENEPTSLILNQDMLQRLGVVDQSREANLTHQKIDHIDSNTFDRVLTLEKLKTIRLIGEFNTQYLQ